MKPCRVVSIVGTRPEAIKMAPVIRELQRRPLHFEQVVLATGQHRELSQQVFSLFDIEPDVNLDLMQENQGLADFASRALTSLSKSLARLRPDVVLIEGDTTTVMAAAMAAFYQAIPVGHVEAGLRSFDSQDPFPEEMNRRVTSCLASLHFAPTLRARHNLLGEGVPDERIFVTGNTVVDALQSVPLGLGFESQEVASIDFDSRRVLLVTAHRRESHGSALRSICQALKTLVRDREDLEVLYPVHPNPNVVGVVREELNGLCRFHLVSPLTYGDLLRAMRQCWLILTDSGGIQEEAPSFHKPVLILREVTERPEVVETGAGKVIGTDSGRIVQEVVTLLESPSEYRKMSEAQNPFGMIAVGEGTRIRVLRKVPFPHSLAWVYTEVTELLGFTPHRDEHKTQWLSLEGEPVFKDVFLEMLRSRSSPLPHLNSGYVNLAGKSLSRKFYREIGLQEEKRELSDDLRRNLARSIQDCCEEIVGSMIEHYRKWEGIQSVCLAGGLFQNALLVANLEKRLGINEIFVPPAPGNSGSALGAGMLVWHQAMQKPRLPAVRYLHTGPACNRLEVKDVLDNCKARYSLQSTVERRLDASLQLLDSGKIVGWFQGGAEFGPRALGNRSLLASPWASYVKENLNDYVKHREWFRPFAVAVPEEDCARYFECSELCQSMNSLARVKPGVNVLPDGFVLPGNLLRLQVVQQQGNPLLWRLLKRFGEQAPAPLLVNTSFNLFGEPLVVKPRDAMRSYFCSGIDALVIDNFVLSKAPAKIAPDSVALPKEALI